MYGGAHELLPRFAHIEDVCVTTGDEYSVVLEFTCVFCDKRGSIAHLLLDDVKWDEDDE